MPRTCRHCGKSSLEVPFYDNGRNICKGCWRAKATERRKRSSGSGLCIDCQTPITKGPLCSTCMKKHRECYHKYKAKYCKVAQARRQRLKRQAMDAYGGCRCACCEETHIEFLTIDHIAQDGAEHRRELRAVRGWKADSSSMAGSHIYLWLKKQGYPSGFRVLCLNCNFALGHYGRCPHQAPASLQEVV